MARPITFLSDYGYADEFAGVCRAVIARIAPQAQLVELTHGVTPHDVRHGAAVLASALPYTPAGVHLAVVDPGVGTSRRAVAVRVASQDRILVGPDNGLLWPAVERLGGAVEAVDVGRSPVRLEPVSATFHGRDLFAPVAAHLALGAPLEGIGEPFDPGGLAELDRPAPRIVGGRLEATVSHLDRFGNIALIAAAEDAAAAGLRPQAPLRVAGAGEALDAVYAGTFADVPEGALLVHVDASGALAIAVNRGSAAQRLGVRGGETVELSPQ